MNINLLTMKEFKLIKTGFVKNRLITLFNASKNSDIRSEIKGMDVLKIKLGNYKFSNN